MHHWWLMLTLPPACLQASVYLDRAALWVLPDAMYGKYVHGPRPIFGHLHGSSWHGDDAKSVLWFLRHPLFLALMGLTMLGGVLLWATAVWRPRWLGLRAGAIAGSGARYVPLAEVITLKSS